MDGRNGRRREAHETEPDSDEPGGQRRGLAGLRRLSRVEYAVRRGASRLSPYRGETETDLDEEHDSTREETQAPDKDLGGTARKTAVVTLVALGIVVAALALWKIRLVVILLFLAFTIAAAMRPGVEALRRRGVPRGIGLALHYLVLVGVLGLVLWLVVPVAIDQVQAALGGNALNRAAQHSTGLKHDILAGLDRRLRHLPSGSSLIHPAVEYGRKAFEIFIAIFFTFAAAAYWVFERDRAVDLVCSLVARPKRRKLRETWQLIDLKLGAFIRGQLLLIVFVAVVLSGLFKLIGLPYWLLVGSFAGLVEIVPVLGPIVAGGVAIGVGFTASVHVAVLAGIVVVAVRLAEDYLVMPRVLGHSVGLTPLVVLVSVTSVGILFGGYAVILAIPIASVAVTLIDVLVRSKEPSEEEVPTVIFPAKDSE